MMDALEVAGEVFDLPALLGANLLPFDSAARAHPLLRAQLVNLRGDRKIFEVLKPAPPLAPLDTPQLFFRLGVRRNIAGVDRLAVQFLSEAEQHLRQLALRLQPIGAGAIVPLAVSLQLYLQAQVLDVQIVGALRLLMGALLVIFGALPLTVALTKQRAALQQQRPHRRFQRFVVIG